MGERKRTRVWLGQLQARVVAEDGDLESRVVAVDVEDEELHLGEVVLLDELRPASGDEETAADALDLGVPRSAGRGGSGETDGDSTEQARMLSCERSRYALRCSENIKIENRKRKEKAKENLTIFVAKSPMQNMKNDEGLRSLELAIFFEVSENF